MSMAVKVILGLFVSSVLVVVIDWIRTGWFPPITKLPIATSLL